MKPSRLVPTKMEAFTSLSPRGCRGAGLGVTPATETVTDETQPGNEDHPSNPHRNGALLLYLRLEIADLHDAPLRAVVQATQGNERPNDEEHRSDHSSKPHETSPVDVRLSACRIGCRQLARRSRTAPQSVERGPGDNKPDCDNGFTHESHDGPDGVRISPDDRECPSDESEVGEAL